MRDLFGCMPVRVKHRALQAEKSSFTRDWDRLGLDVVALLTAWPGAVFVSLRDAATQQSLSLKVSSESRNWLKDSCRLLYQASLRDSPAVSDWVPIGISSPTLSISGYVSREPVATKRAQFISLGIEPLSNESRCNVLYEEVNKVFAESSFGLVEDESDQDETPKKTKTDGFTQRELNARKGVDRWPMFFLKMTPTASSLGADDILEGPQPNLTIITGLLKAVFFEFLKRNQCRPRKAVVFTKPKSCSQQEHRRKHRTDDLASAASSKKRQKTTDPILALAGELTRETSRLEILDSRPDLLPVSKIKSGRLLHTFEASAPSRSRTQSICTTPTPSSRDGTPEHITTASRGSMSAEPLRPSLFTADGKLTRRPFDDINSQHAASRSTTQEPTYASMPTEQPAASSAPLLQDETLEWVNPVTKMAATIHSQTDFAMAVAPKSLTLSRRDSEQKSKEAKSGADVPTRESKAASSWVTNLISKWKNPVFELTEPPVPKLPDVADTLGLEPHVTDHRCHHGQSAFTMGTRHETTMMGRQGRFSKDTLKKAQLIAQVDTKFIFAKVLFERTEGSTEDDSVLLELSPVLVLIDQHAADERCRVEELMAGYFKPSAEKNGKQIWEAVTENLQKPVQFELSGQDKDLLRQSQPYFSYWGICYDVEASISSTKDKKTSRSIKVKISVRSLPPAILERCRTDPRLLAELIRREAWRLKDEDKPVHSPKSRPVLPQDLEGRVPVWVSLFHACPPGVLELINSRSCRSRLKFYTNLLLARAPYADFSHRRNHVQRPSHPRRVFSTLRQVDGVRIPLPMRPWAAVDGAACGSGYWIDGAWKPGRKKRKPRRGRTFWAGIYEVEGEHTTEEV